MHIAIVTRGVTYNVLVAVEWTAGRNELQDPAVVDECAGLYDDLAGDSAVRVLKEACIQRSLVPVDGILGHAEVLCDERLNDNALAFFVVVGSLNDMALMLMHVLAETKKSCATDTNGSATFNEVSFEHECRDCDVQRRVCSSGLGLGSTCLFGGDRVLAVGVEDIGVNIIPAMADGSRSGGCLCLLGYTTDFLVIIVITRTAVVSTSASIDKASQLSASCTMCGSCSSCSCAISNGSCGFVVALF